MVLGTTIHQENYATPIGQILDHIESTEPALDAVRARRAGHAVDRELLSPHGISSGAAHASHGTDSSPLEGPVTSVTFEPDPDPSRWSMGRDPARRRDG